MSEPHVHTWEPIGDAEDGSPLFRCACGLYRLLIPTAPDVNEGTMLSWLEHTPFLETLTDAIPEV